MILFKPVRKSLAKCSQVNTTLSSFTRGKVNNHSNFTVYPAVWVVTFILNPRDFYVKNSEGALSDTFTSNFSKCMSKRHK